jgi:hypothetical protein
VELSLILTDDEFPRFSGLWLRIPYSEFVIGSSRFLYPIKITETLLSKIQERTGRSENPVFYLTVL